MSLELITQPNKTINDIESQPNAARTQLPFVFQRWDYEWDDLFNSGRPTGEGNLRILFNGVDKTSEFSAGDFIYFKTKSDTVNNYGPLLVQLISVEFIANNTNLYFDGEWLGYPGSNGVLNNLTSRTNYRVNLRAMFDGANLFEPLVFNYVPDPTGRLFVDIGPALLEHLKTAEILSQLFTLEFWESWDGTSVPYFAPGGSLTSGGGVGDFYFLLPASLGTDFSVFPIGSFIRWDEIRTGNTGQNQGLPPDWGEVVGHLLVNGNQMRLDINYPNYGTLGDWFSGAIYPGVGYGESLQVQAVAARLDRAAEFGSNMFDNLLRVESGFNIEFNGVNYFDDGGGFTWNGSNWSTPSQPSTVILKLRTTTPETFKNGVKFQIYIDYRYTYVKDAQSIRLAIYDGSAWEYTQIQTTGEYPSGTRVQKWFTVNDTHSNPITLAMVEVVGGTGTDHEMTIFDLKGTEAAKLLTRFENPLLWRNWARSVSCLTDALIGDRNGTTAFYFRYNGADINKQISGGSTTRPIPSLNAPNVYTDLVEPHFLADYKFSVAKVITDGANDAVSEELFFKQLEPCKNPVCVRWLNSLGGWDEHLFSISQVLKTTNSEGTIYNNPVSVDLYTDNQRTKGRTNVDEIQTMLLTAENLTRDQFEALKEIKNSESVFIYLTKDGSELLPVICRENLMTEIDTDGGFFRFDVTLELPDGTDFYKAKKY